MNSITPPLDGDLALSHAAQWRWVRILGQLVTMQMIITREKLHAVGRGLQ